MLITCHGKVVASAAIPHFAQNFALFEMVSKNWFNKVFEHLKNDDFDFLEVFLSFLIGKILMQNASDREFCGLSESLPRSVSKLSIARKKIKVICEPIIFEPTVYF
jgi:hypothetical protein